MLDESKTMKTRQLGDITINRILEFHAPMDRPRDFFDEATPDAVAPHRPWLEPWALDPVTGKMVMACQLGLPEARSNASSFEFLC